MANGYRLRGRPIARARNDRGETFEAWKAIAFQDLENPPRGPSWAQLLWAAWLASEDPEAWRRGFEGYQRAKARADSEERAPF